MTSSVECHTISISQYVDHYLQTHAKKLKSDVKDTTGNIKRIKNLGKIPENTILATMDVCSLCTHIPHKEDIKAVETTLKRKNKPTSAIITFLKLILTSTILSLTVKTTYNTKDRL